MAAPTVTLKHIAAELADQNGVSKKEATELLEGMVSSFVKHLKAGEREFSDPFRIRALVRKYSDHIAFPVRLGEGAVVNRALEEAYAEGDELAFLIADDDDWPKEFYARLGFSPVGRLAEFTKQP